MLLSCHSWTPFAIKIIREIQLRNNNFFVLIYGFIIERPEIKSAVCIPGSEEENHILDICKYKSKWTGRRWLDDFDYVAFLNTK